MTHDGFGHYCSQLPATMKVTQWGNSRVRGVGWKVFAAGSWNEEEPGFTFKVDSETFSFLRDQTRLKPAPYRCEIR